MTSLREIQADVMQALRGSPQRAVPHLAGPAEAARARLGIYRVNRQQNFAEALESTYPAVARLVGKDYFRQTVREFQRRQPSRSGDLIHAGAGFADYVGELHRDDAFAYLGDVARLEWLIECALLSADHAPLDLDKLSRVPPAEYDTLRFKLHPSLRLFESCYPALRIWETNLESDTEPQTLRLDSGGDRLALLRPALRLEVHRLSAAEQRFLDALAHGEEFAAALLQASLEDAGDDSFDPTAALQRFVAVNAIVDFR